MSIAQHIIPDLRDDVARFELAVRIAEQLKDVLDDKIHFSPASIFWIHPNSRENLVALMTLAPRWAKRYDTEGIDYTATIDGVKVTLKAAGDALPGTCQMVEVEVEVEAQPEKRIPAVPAHTEKRMVLKCDHAEKETPITTPIT